MASTISTSNLFAELGVTDDGQEPQEELFTTTKDDSAPSSLRIRAQPLQLRYVDDRINDPAIRDWMEERRLGVGASEIAVLFGLSPWQTLEELWDEKVNGCSYEPGCELFHFGHEMEPLIAKEFGRREKVDVDHPPQAIMIGEKPYYRASLDRVVVEDGVPVAALELKNLNESRHSEYRAAGPSIGYLLQLQYQMMVAELEYGFLACLFGGQKFAAWRVLASPSLQREIRQRVDEFWGYVESRTPPPSSLGKRPIGQTEGHVLVLSDPGWEQKFQEIESLRLQKAKIDKEEKVLKQQIKECLGDHQSAQAGQMVASVTSSSRRSLDSKRLKEENPDLVQRYMRENEVRFIRVKRRS